MWDTQKDTERFMAEPVANLSRLTACLRGQITRGASDDNRTIQLEQPYRLMTVLMNIARGHAIASWVAWSCGL